MITERLRKIFIEIIRILIIDISATRILKSYKVIISLLASIRTS